MLTALFFVWVNSKILRLQNLFLWLVSMHLFSFKFLVQLCSMIFFFAHSPLSIFQWLRTFSHWNNYNNKAKQETTKAASLKVWLQQLKLKVTWPKKSVRKTYTFKKQEINDELHNIRVLIKTQIWLWNIPLYIFKIYFWKDVRLQYDLIRLISQKSNSTIFIDCTTKKHRNRLC